MVITVLLSSVHVVSLFNYIISDVPLPVAVVAVVDELGLEQELELQAGLEAVAGHDQFVVAAAVSVAQLELVGLGVEEDYSRVLLLLPGQEPG